jgi:hypothetical protein
MFCSKISMLGLGMLLLRIKLLVLTFEVER